jgi:CheY-like chemotaxis protein
MLMNLVVNARDAMPDGGRIEMETSNVWIDENYARMEVGARPGRYVCIRVCDTGTGIPAEIIDKLFDPFFTTKEFGKGTGLGLSTVMTIVKGHGGFITVQSEERKGAEFKVFLPAAELPVTQEEDLSILDMPVGHDELILVVDDESAVREITKSTLEAYGYRVLTAADGTEAVGLLAQYKNEVKVMLTDLMMPYMDGPATIRVMQKLNPQIKVVVSSGVKLKDRDIEAANLESIVFLPKPYTADKLLKAIAEALNHEKARAV